MQVNFSDYERSFAAAQQTLHGDIDTTDRSQLVLGNNTQEVHDFLRHEGSNSAGFYPVEINNDRLRALPALFIGRALLMYNGRLGALSPVVISASLDNSPAYQISMFEQPYDPDVGFSTGMHWGLSIKAQSRLTGFGGHGSDPSGLEQGHFGVVLVGARSQATAATIKSQGDQATHQILRKGVVEAMTGNDMLPVSITTRDLPGDTPFRLMAYWHDKIQNNDGPIGGDFPEATRLMLGAGLHALGQSALSNVEYLVKDVVRAA